MRTLKISLLALIISFIFSGLNPSTAQCNRFSDSLVLIDLYNANPGVLFWDIAGTPVDSWSGIEMNGSGCVTNIDLNETGLFVLPESIGMLSGLLSLQLENNNISELPESIRGWRQIENINLNFNNLDTLPEALGSLPRLEILYLNENKLRFLIPEMGMLSRLERLEVNKNELEKLPDEIGDLPELMFLYLTENRITEIPSSIGSIPKLLELNLESNFIQEIPSEIGNLSRLKVLNFSGNQLSQLPLSIANLTNLEILNLYKNDLPVFPETIGSLTALTYLNYGGNKIISIPDNIGNLTKLKSLYLHNNNIYELPSTIGNLVFLEILWINSNFLSNLPDSIGELIRLDYLSAYNNNLREIPSNMGRLTTLNYLYLQNNRLTELPESLSNLENLWELRLQNNDLQRLPSQMDGFESLKELNIRNNNIKDLPPPTAQLTALEDIDVVDNAFSFEDINVLKDFIDEPLVQVKFTPQNPFANDTLYYFKKGVSGTIDLGYDGGISGCDYEWFKDEQEYTPGPGNDTTSNLLVFDDPSLADIGVYRAVSVNPDFSSLTVQSSNISVKVCDRRNDSLELVKLYEQTDGQKWKNNTNWRVPGMPIETWSGVTVDALGCVSKVDLAGNMLTGSVPDLQMNSLDTLILSDNELIGFNNEIFVPYIKYVDLSNNKIAVLPEVINRWMQLQNLLLTNAFDFNGFQPSANGIPPEIGDLCDLTELEMAGNGFEGEVPTELTMLSNLKKGQVTFANNALDSVRRELIYFCPYGVEIMANNPGGFEKFVEICGDTCGGLEFEQLADLPWLMDTIKSLNCTGNGCYDNNVRSDAGFVIARDLKVVYTRTRCYDGLESYTEVIKLYDCGGNILENIGCNSDRLCSGLGVLNESEFGGLVFESKWSCGCDFSECKARDTVIIDEGEIDTLKVGDFVLLEEVCNPGFYSISSVNNELPGSPPIVTEDNIGFTYELVTENLISSQQCTTTIDVVRGATGRNEYENQDPDGPVMIACHPNPVVDFLRCPEIDMVNVEEYKVYNLQGMEMPKYVESYKDKLQLNVQEYPSGMYILHVKTKDRQYLNRFMVFK